MPINTAMWHSTVHYCSGTRWHLSNWQQQKEAFHSLFLSYKKEKGSVIAYLPNRRLLWHWIDTIVRGLKCLDPVVMTKILNPMAVTSNSTQESLLVIYGSAVHDELNTHNSWLLQTRCRDPTSGWGCPINLWLLFPGRRRITLYMPYFLYCSSKVSTVYPHLR